MNKEEEQEGGTVDHSPALRRSMVVGSLWMVGMRWVIRGVGLLSTIILARLLVPADFGLVAMAMLFIGLFDILTSFGVDLALIRDTRADRPHFDTAWTIQIFQGFIVALLLFITAPFAAAYYNEPRVIPIIQVLALSLVIQGFTNIGIISFRKDLSFSKEFWYTVIKRLVVFIVTIGVAIQFRSYWALVIGIVVGQIIAVPLSFLMNSYRPRFNLSKVREIWSFSQWMLLSNIGDYVFNRSDEMIVGGITDARNLGIYSVSSEISNLPTTELIFPLSRALFPGYAKLAYDPKRLIHAYLNVLGFVALFAIASGVGIALVAKDLTSVLLGDKWMSAVPIIQCLAMFGVIRAVYGHAGNVLLAFGHVKAVSILVWLQVLVLVPCAVFAGMHLGIIGVAVTKVGVALLFACMLFVSLTRVSPITIKEIAQKLWRPFIAAIFMSLAVLSRQHMLVIDNPFVSLLIDALIGSVSYLFTIATLWQVMGRPNGAEQFLIEMIGKKLRGRGE